MARKVVAALMDVSFVKFCRKEWAIKRTTKKCLVYDPKHVVPKKEK